MQAKSEEVSHVQATWEHHENTMIEAQIQLADLKLVLEAAQKAEAEAQAAREAAETRLTAQSSELERARSRLAGAEAVLDELRSQVGFAQAGLGSSPLIVMTDCFDMQKLTVSHGSSSRKGAANAWHYSWSMQQGS